MGIVEPREEVISEAQDLLFRVSVKTLDSIHLASAIILKQIIETSYPFVTSDKQLAVAAEKLNISKEEMIRESLKVFLEKKLREIKTEMYEIRVKYKVSSVEEFEELYRRGQIEEKDTWQELQRLDHLEFKKDEIEGILRSL